MKKKKKKKLEKPKRRKFYLYPTARTQPSVIRNPADRRKPRVIRTQIFQIKYEKPLSLHAKMILKTLSKKYFYHAIDDIFYLLRSTPMEQQNVLSALYAPVISLQNDYSVDFFDIWINQVYIHEPFKVNKFLTNDSNSREPFCYITLRLVYLDPIIKVKKRKYLRY